MERVGRAACLLGGCAWLALVLAAELFRRGELGYDGYYRLVAIPLLCFLVGFGLWGRDRLDHDGRARLGYVTATAGLALAFAGDALEFWGAPILGETNSFEASRSGGETWWGSDIGWTLFMLGFFALAFGGPTAAVALRRAGRTPTWLFFLVALLGPGVLMANLLHDRPLVVTVPVLGIFGAGWVALGAREALWRRGIGPPRDGRDLAPPPKTC